MIPKEKAPSKASINHDTHSFYGYKLGEKQAGHKGYILDRYPDGTPSSYIYSIVNKDNIVCAILEIKLVQGLNEEWPLTKFAESTKLAFFLDYGNPIQKNNQGGALFNYQDIHILTGTIQDNLLFEAYIHPKYWTERMKRKTQRH